jgi:hypothetical protein
MCMFVKVGHGSTRVGMAKEDSLYISASGALQCNAILIVNDQLDAQFFFYVFISVLCRFGATSCSSSGESVVSIKNLLFVTLCR